MPQEPIDAPDLLAVLNGEAGAEAQVRALELVIARQVSATFDLFRVVAGDGVGAVSMPGNHFIFQRP